MVFDGMYYMAAIIWSLIFIVGIVVCLIAAYGVINEATKYYKRNARKKETLDN